MLLVTFPAAFLKGYNGVQSLRNIPGLYSQPLQGGIISTSQNPRSLIADYYQTQKCHQWNSSQDATSWR